MRIHIAITLVLLLVSVPFVSAQLKQQQTWQNGTVASDALTIQCSQFLLPSTKGALLSEPSPITTDGEMAHSLRSAHPVKIILQPESGTSDNLDTISGCAIDGVKIQIRMADEADSVTVVHGTGANNISTPDATNLVMSGTKRIYTFHRAGGLWIYESGGGGGGSSGGNVVIGDGQLLTINADYLNGNEGIKFNPAVTSCSSAITSGQLCIDYDDKCIYLGNGTSVDLVSCGGDIVGCTDADNCFEINQVVDGLVGEVNSVVFKGAASGGSCVKLFEDADGFVIKAYDDCGGGGEAAAAPTELKPMPMPVGKFSPDGTLCDHVFNQTINTLKVPVVITCAVDDTATMIFMVVMPDQWDGATFKISGLLHTAEATPAGVIELDWTGYCVLHGGANGGASWATEDANGTMQFTLDGHAQHDLIQGDTAGDVPLSNCTGGSAPRVMWIRAQIDATATTADDDHVTGGKQIDVEYFLEFKATYALRQFSEN